jgi:hypothetical protein
MNLFALVVSGIVGTVLILTALLAQVLEWRDRLEKYPTLKKLTEAKVLRVLLLIFGIGLLAGVLEETNRIREALERPPVAPKPPLPINAQSLCGNNAMVPAQPGHGTTGVSGNKVAGNSNVLGTITQQGKNNIAQQGSGNTATINAVPPARRIKPEASSSMLPDLMASKPTVNVRAVTGDNEAQQLGVDIYATLKSAGWTMQNPIVMSFIKVGGPVEPGVTVFFRGAPVTSNTQLSLPNSDPKMALANLLRKSDVTVNFVPQLDTPEGFLDIQVGPAPNPD